MWECPHCKDCYLCHITPQWMVTMTTVETSWLGWLMCHVCDVSSNSFWTVLGLICILGSGFQLHKHGSFHLLTLYMCVANQCDVCKMGFVENYFPWLFLCDRKCHFGFEVIYNSSSYLVVTVARVGIISFLFVISDCFKWDVYTFSHKSQVL